MKKAARILIALGHVFFFATCLLGLGFNPAFTAYVPVVAIQPTFEEVGRRLSLMAGLLWVAGPLLVAGYALALVRCWREQSVPESHQPAW